MKIVLSWFIALCCLTGCEDEDEEGGATPDDLCASGLRWSGGNSESPFMRPGGDCIGCHAALGEGPTFVVAGTVHATLDEPADCYGVEGVAVTITDATGQNVELVTNEAGNFFLDRRMALAMPVRARLAFEGRERAMVLQTDGACATCHTPTGTSNAPGRILAP